MAFDCARLQEAAPRFDGVFKLSEQILERLPVPFVATHKDGAILYSNRTFDLTFNGGLDNGSHGGFIQRILAGGDRAYRELVNYIALNDGRLEEHEVQSTGRDGLDRTLHVSATQIESKGLPLILLVFQDITEKKQLEASIVENERRMLSHQRLESLGTLAGGIAHEFNNMLQPMILLTESVMRSLVPGSTDYEDLRVVLASGMRVGDLVSRILEFSRSEEPAETEIDLGAAVQEVARLIRRTFPTTIMLDVQIEPLPQPCVATAHQIHQLLLNLSTNARDAMDGHGQLSITVDPIHIDGFIGDTHRGCPPGVYGRLLVQDTGAGMDRSVLDRATEPFFTTKPAGVGTGLGLSIVHGIVTSLRGWMDIESAPGLGTTVTILLPTRFNMHVTEGAR